MKELKYLGILEAGLFFADSEVFYGKLKQTGLLGNSIFLFGEIQKYDLGFKDEFITEVYFFLQKYIEKDHFYILAPEKVKHTIKMNSFLRKEDKALYLKEQHQFYFNRLINYNGALSYIQNDTENWELHIKWTLASIDRVFLRRYLCSNLPVVVEEIKSTSFFSEWTDCYVSLKMTAFIKQQLQELEAENKVPTEKKQNYDASLQTLLFDKIMKIDNWDELSDNKKAELFSLFSDKNKDNIRKTFAMMNKKGSEATAKFKADSKKADEILSKILKQN